MNDERPMPANDDAERAVLGSVLINGTGAYDRVLPIVDPSAFRSDEHRAIFRTFIAMEGKGIDLLTVKAKLMADGLIDKVGGAAYLSSLTDRIPDIANVEHYARIVRETALRRRTIVECGRLQAAAYSGEAISDLAANGALLFSDIAASRDDGPRPVKDVAQRTWSALEKRMSEGSWVTGIPTSLHKLDAYTLGLQRGVLSVMGARPRVGKTAVALAIALFAAKAGLRVLIIQLDMSERMFGNRLLAAVSNVSSFKIRSGRFLDDDEHARIAIATAQLKKLGDRILIDHKTRDLAKIVAIGRREAHNNGLDLIIVDHIGHVQGGRGEKRYLEIGNVSSRLIELAGETDAAALALVQLGRDAEGRVPTLSDLRESGNLEQDARVVVLLDRPSLRGDKVPECQLNVLVPKNEGETGADIVAHFNLQVQRVTEEPDTRCQHCGAADGPSREQQATLQLGETA